MQQIISHRSFENLLTPSIYVEREPHVSSIRRFIAWCEHEEENRLLWLGIAIIGLIGTVVPLTLLSVLFLAGNNFTLWIIVLTVNMPVLALNLAAQPPKITIPVMAGALIIDILVIALSVVMALI